MPRKVYDGEKLAADVARLHEADRDAPPTARPSLMDAVRGFATYIETRIRLGWTDAMIAVVLTEAGYTINADTLRSYRSRMRDEGLLPAVRTAHPKPAASKAGKAETTENPAPSAATTATSRSKGSDAGARIEDASPRAPPAVHASRFRSLPVNPSKLPSDEA